MIRRLRWWHLATLSAGGAAAVLALWIALAYGGLPRLWSRHEHRHPGPRDALLSYTAQDIPGDPVNLRLTGSRAAVECAFRAAGWHPAAPVTLRSSLGIAASVLFGRRDPDAPVSPLYIADQPQAMAWQIDAGRSADRRHHVRLWPDGAGGWLAAATFDRGVGFSLYTLQITHHIGPEVDGERAMVGAALMRAGATPAGFERSNLAPGWRRNGGGDRYRTDGRVAHYRLRDCTPARAD